jgi:hypothetical protein
MLAALITLAFYRLQFVVVSILRNKEITLALQARGCAVGQRLTRVDPVVAKT